MPLGGDHEKRLPVGTSYRTGETAAIQRDRLQHRTPFADMHTTLVGDIRIPQGIGAADADAVGNMIPQIGPDPPVSKLPSRVMSKAVNLFP